MFDWKAAPEQYGAIHFHDDDIDDARWAVTFEWKVPTGTSSKFYAAKLTSTDGDEDYIPFWVVPRVGEEQSKIAFMVPTISYMAYANEHLANNGGRRRTPGLSRADHAAAEHVPVRTSRIWRVDLRHPHRWQRPVFVVAVAADPEHPSEIRSLLAQAPWQYPADLHLIYWLETMGYKYDVITDEDVSYDGLARLENYNVVISGSHPEHNSGPQLDALHDYTQHGGRLHVYGRRRLVLGSFLSSGL